MTTKQDKLNNQVLELLKTKTIADITAYLVITDAFPSKAEAKAFVLSLVPSAEKKVPMSKQLTEWIVSQENKLALTDTSILAQGLALGMTELSAKHYVASYKLAVKIALSL